MGSPIQIGDIVLLSQIAFKVHQGFKSAPDELKSLSTQVFSIHTLLQQIKESFEQIDLDEYEERNLTELVSRCVDILKEVRQVIKYYHSIRSENGKRKKLKWLLDSGRIRQLKQDLMDQLHLLTSFNSAITVRSLAGIKDQMAQLPRVAPMRSTDHTRLDEDDVDWPQLHNEFDEDSIASPDLASYSSEKDARYSKGLDKKFMDLGKGWRCVFCGQNDHSSESCGRMSSFDTDVGSCVGALTIPEDESPQTPPTYYSENPPRRYTAPVSLNKKRPTWASFGSDSTIAAGFGPGSGPQLPVHYHRPSSVSTDSSSSFASRHNSNDGSVVTDPGPKKRSGLGSSFRSKMASLGASSPSTQHGFS